MKNNIVCLAGYYMQAGIHTARNAVTPSAPCRMTLCMRNVVSKVRLRCRAHAAVRGAQAFTAPHLQVRRAGLNAIFVFVAPPSIEELEKRLRGRGTESEEQIQRRLSNAKEEIAR